MIGCRCDVCRSTDPHDRRSRPSILFELANGVRVLVDTTPDLRTQALAHDLDRVDAILFTHCHADHVMGLDEVRRFNVLQRAAIPCYGDADTLQEIRRTFAYIFESKDEGGGIPLLDLHSLDGPVVDRRPGIRAGAGVARAAADSRLPRAATSPTSPTAAAFPTTSWPLLEGLDTLAIDALRHRPHPTHFTVEQAIGVSARLARPADLVDAHLPRPAARGDQRVAAAGVELAYDGLRIEI